MCSQAIYIMYLYTTLTLTRYNLLYYSTFHSLVKMMEIFRRIALLLQILVPIVLVLLVVVHIVIVIVLQQQLRDQ